MALPRLTGYAALFSPAVSEDLGDFTETVAPGCFDRALREKHDVRALLNHEASLILGRTKSGTLRLSVDPKGLRVDLDPPETTVGRDCVEMVRRQDLDQMSYCFRAVVEDWKVVGDQLRRTLVDVDLIDVSVVVFPATLATSIAIARDAAPQRAGVPNSVNLARLRLSAS